ncbi:MAG TPA: ATP-grasp domain-containing protein, partial [Ktedonobacterales bacterium]
MKRQRANPGVVVLGSDFKALGVVRSLARRGVPCALVDSLPRCAWFSRYVTRRVKWKDALEGEAFVQFLLADPGMRDFAGWALLPAQDDAVEVVSQHFEELSARYRLLTLPWEVMRWAGDKRLTHQLAADAGVPCPRTVYPTSEHELVGVGMSFPVIVKPAISIRFQHATRLKALRADSPEELLVQYRRACQVLSPDEIMVQELIPGGGRQQVSVAVYADAGQTLLAMTARRSRQYPVDFGLGSSYVEAVAIPEIEDLAKRVVAQAGFSGMLEVEFKRDDRDGFYKLLDINVRPWGWHTLSQACGLDFPAIHYMHALGEPVPQLTPRYGAHWVRVLTDIPAAFTEMRRGTLRADAYARSLMGRAVWSVFAWSDPAPAFG